MCKPRNRDNHFFARYKEAKREFRKELRRKAREQEVNEFDALQQTFEVDRSEFYKRLSNARSPKCKPGNALKVDGKLVTNKEKVLEIWREHYQGLYSPLEHEQFDDSFRKYVEERILVVYEIESHEVNDDPLDLPFTAGEVASICQHLPNGKAGGLDQIQYEHLTYGGKACCDIY